LPLVATAVLLAFRDPAGKAKAELLWTDARPVLICQSTCPRIIWSLYDKVSRVGLL